MTTTTDTADVDELAERHDALKAASAARAARRAAEQRRERSRQSAERVLERTEPRIAALEELASAMEAVVDRLTERRNELAAEIESNPTPPGRDLLDLEAHEEALDQAAFRGAPVHRGVSLHEGGGTTPMQVRIPHPLLVEADPELDWEHPLEAIQGHLADLKAQRDAAARRLEDFEDAA